MKEKVKQLLERTVNLLGSDEDFPAGTSEKLVKDIKEILDEEECRELYSAFRYHLDENIVKEFIENKDKIGFVEQYGNFESVKPFVIKYWNNMDKLFEKLDYLIKLCDKAGAFYYTFDEVLEAAKIDEEKENEEDD